MTTHAGFLNGKNWMLPSGFKRFLSERMIQDSLYWLNRILDEQVYSYRVTQCKSVARVFFTAF